MGLENKKEYNAKGRATTRFASPAVAIAGVFAAFGDISSENRNFRFVLGDDATAKSLVVGFELIPYEAEIGVEKGRGFLQFRLNRFLVDRKEHFGGFKTDIPPVKEFRVVQLPVKQRVNYGLWLNTMHDDRAAMAVVGTSSWPRVYAESVPAKAG